MSDHPMTCSDFEENLGAYLEGDLDPATQTAAERHRAGCARCAGLAADLQRIATEAAALPTLRPSRDLWAGIAGRLESPVVELDAHRRVTRVEPVAGPRQRSTWSMAAAAAALVALTAGVTYEFATRPAGTAPQAVALRPDTATAPEVGPRVEPSVVPAAPASTARQTAAVPPGATTLDTMGVARPAGTPAGSTTALVARRESVPGEAVLDREIGGLRAVVRQRRDELDPATVEILERNMRVIDAAIRDSREALAADPRSPFLGDRLSRALDRKVQLLRTAAALPSRT